MTYHIFNGSKTIDKKIRPKAANTKICVMLNLKITAARSEEKTNNSLSCSIKRDNIEKKKNINIILVFSFILDIQIMINKKDITLYKEGKN